MPAWDGAQHHFGKSLRPTHSQGHRGRAPLVEGRTPSDVCTYFKTATLLYYRAFIFITPCLFFKSSVALQFSHEKWMFQTLGFYCRVDYCGRRPMYVRVGTRWGFATEKCSTERRGHPCGASAADQALRPVSPASCRRRLRGRHRGVGGAPGSTVMVHSSLSWVL